VDKTSVYLAPEERRLLERIAAREQVSQAEIIRRAIRAYEPSARRDRDFQLARSFDGPGDSIADHDEDALLAGFGE
jgi:hypothetical protein